MFEIINILRSIQLYTTFNKRVNTVYTHGLNCRTLNQKLPNQLTSIQIYLYDLWSVSYTYVAEMHANTKKSNLKNNCDAAKEKEIRNGLDNGDGGE